MCDGRVQPILLVEDNHQVREVIRTLLEEDGFVVREADDGVEALRQLGAGLSPCLILLDCHMPVMDGREFRLRQLKEGLQVDVPVILHSADPQVRTDGLRVEAVLSKPVNFIDLLVMVEQYCARSRLRSDPVHGGST